MTDAQKMSHETSRMLPKLSKWVDDGSLSSPPAYFRTNISSTTTSVQSQSTSEYSVDEDGEGVWPDGCSPRMELQKFPVEPNYIEASRPPKANDCDWSELGPSLRALLNDSSRDNDLKLAPIHWRARDATSESQSTLHSRSESIRSAAGRSEIKCPTKRDSSDVADQYPWGGYHVSTQASNGYYHGPYYYPYPHYYPYDPHYYQYYSGHYATYSRSRPPIQKAPKPLITATLTHSETEKPKRQKKDPNAPKHPMSAFLYYLSAMRKKYTKMYPEYGVGMISKVIAAEWKELTDAQKEPYVKLSEADKSRYSKEMHEWHEKMYRLPCK
jgi:hypothetical protein